MIKKMIFNMAYKKKKAAITSGSAVFEEAEKSTSFYNKLVFSKMKGRIGGRMRAIVSS
jgi:long-subunit acyl-CoA synthetase (AMP-forming)